MNLADFDLAVYRKALENMAFDLLVSQKTQREIESTRNPYAHIMVFRDQVQDEIKAKCRKYMEPIEDEYRKAMKVETDIWDDYFKKLVEDYKNSPKGKKDMEDWNRRIWINVTCKRCGSQGRVFVSPESKEYFEKKWQCCSSARLNLWQRVKKVWENLMNRKNV